MKKVALALTVLFLSLPVPAHAASTVTLTAPSHRHLDGTFTDDQLAKDLEPAGKYGAPLFNNYSSVNTWKIDPSFIEDIQAMSLGYKVAGVGEGKGKDVAGAWLKRLKAVTQGDRIEAIVYANPSEYWIAKFFPHDRDFLLNVSAARLTRILERYVYPPKGYETQGYFSLTSPQARLMNIAEDRVALSAAYLQSGQLEDYKLAELKILNASLTSSQRQSLAYDLAAVVNELRNSVRVSTGKFTITSANQKVPITLTNDFAQPIAVDLLIRSTNEKIYVDNIENVLVAGKSKIQVMIPIKTFASGDSGFVITVKGHTGGVYGQDVTYPLKIVVISPVATWITGAAALVLFGAAILKSLRRIRRGRKGTTK